MMASPTPPSLPPGGGKPDCEHAPPVMSEDEVALERAHFTSVQRAFAYYGTYADRRLQRARRAFDAMPQHHREMLPNYTRKLRSLAVAMGVNAEFTSTLAEDMDIFLNTTTSASGPVSEAAAHAAAARVPPAGEMSRVCTTLKQFFRDWSAEGAAERAACYDPLLLQLEKLYGAVSDRSSVRILVPGAGLGRLVWECAARGFASQGNEFSAYMLVASNFILNKAKERLCVRLFPFVHQFSNVYKATDTLASIAVPDVDPSQLPAGADFSMAAGDFLEVYTDAAAWDCVCSCFFLDTAANIVAYIERIYRLLKPGGHLINFGPLLYHYEDDLTVASVELSYTEVRDVLCSCGFIIEEERYPLECTYIGHPESMMQTVYKCVFFDARKPTQAELDAASEADDRE